MKNINLTLALILSLFLTLNLSAQEVTVTPGGTSKFELIKGASNYNFSNSGIRYFISEYFKDATTNYYLRSFNAEGKLVGEGPLEINRGVFNNDFTIIDIQPFGDKVYAFIEHRDKGAGKNTLLVRTVEPNGDISKTEKELLNFPFERIMKSGDNYISVSPDNKTLAVVTNLPSKKKEPEEYLINVYDTNLKKIANDKIVFTEEPKGSLSTLVANDGTIYWIRKGMTKNGETELTVQQWSQSNKGKLKDYSLALEHPVYVTSYASAISPENELVISGTTYKRQTVSTGESKATGIFYFTTKDKQTGVFKTFELDQPIENLNSRKVLVNGNTVFLTAEQLKVEKNTPPAGTSSIGFDYTYTYNSGANHVIAMDHEGNKKFQTSMDKSFVTRNFNQPYETSYFILNDKLAMFFNDNLNKYVTSAGMSSMIPVMIQVSNDGLMSDPVVFMDKLKMPENKMLYPSFAVQDNQNQVTLLTGDRDDFKLVTLNIK